MITVLFFTVSHRGSISFFGVPAFLDGRSHNGTVEKRKYDGRGRIYVHGTCGIRQPSTFTAVMKQIHQKRNITRQKLSSASVSGGGLWQVSLGGSLHVFYK